MSAFQVSCHNSESIVEVEGRMGIENIDEMRG